MSCTGANVIPVGTADDASYFSDSPFGDPVAVELHHSHPGGGDDQEHYTICITGDVDALTPAGAGKLAKLLTTAAKQVHDLGGDDDGEVEPDDDAVVVG